ncbi:MAG: DUF819 family protein [Planctomycetota bacterium]
MPSLLLAAAENSAKPLVESDAVVFGMLMAILGLIFYTASSESPALKKFYQFVPMLVLCYFLPSLLTLFNIVNPEQSQLYFVASRYLLPASLVLLTISVDLKEILRLGPKALIMFLTGTAGVVIGGPLAIFLFSLFDPSSVGGEGADAIWRGLSTVAGSWIGGGANQLAMKEIWMADEFANESLFTAMIAVDVVIAEVWMFFLLLGVGQHQAIDRMLRADASAIGALQQKMEHYTKSTARIPTTADLMVIAAVGFGVCAMCHYLAGLIAPAVDEFVAQDPSRYQWLRNFSLHKEFFWVVVLATTLALGLSFTRVRQLEGAGASKLGTVFIFILVAVIGMRMDIRAVVAHPKLFLVGGIWMVFHVGLMVLVGYLIRAPFFYIAVGSKANIGGVASAPVIAAAFHPSLAPVGVLLAVLGYVLGTYGAYLCGVFMQAVAPL